MSDENVGGLVELLACPCCNSPAQLSDEYEDCDGNPAVECSQCNLLSWAVSDWNTRVSAHGQPVVDEAMVSRALAASNDYWSDPAHEVKCEACDGTGRVPCGDGQDYCACGCGFLHAGTDEGAMRAALTAALTGADHE